MEKKTEKKHVIKGTPNPVPELDNADKKPEPEATRTAGSFVAELIFSLLLIAAICALRTVHIFASNVGLITFSDLGSDMWIYMGASAAVFGSPADFSAQALFCRHVCRVWRSACRQL